MYIDGESAKTVTGFEVGRKSGTHVLCPWAGVAMGFLDESHTEEKVVC